MSAFILMILLVQSNIAAQTAEEKGLEIAIEADNRDAGFLDSVTELKMILRNRHGEESTREMRNKTLEVEKSQILAYQDVEQNCIFIAYP